MNRLCAVFLLVVCICSVSASPAPQSVGEISRSFEFRYFDDNTSANGETDFKGRTAVFDTNERIEFLGRYADYAKKFFDDPGLDTKAVTDAEVESFLGKLKAQPLPKIRRKIPFGKCKWIGNKKGQAESQAKKLESWKNIKGVKVQNDSLVFTEQKVEFQKSFPAQSWRFYLQWKVKPDRADTNINFSLYDEEKPAITVGFNSNGKIFYTSEQKQFESASYQADKWYSFKLEVDLVNSRYNFYVDGKSQADFVKLQNQNITQINSMVVQGTKATMLDDIWGLGFLRSVEPDKLGTYDKPFSVDTFIEQDFDIKPSLEGWSGRDYNDDKWLRKELPIVHGGERYAGEYLYLRKNVKVGDFSRAVLNIETLDPGGSVWVNGEPTAVLDNRHPAKIDITEHLEPNTDNLIAIKVKPFSVKHRMHHTPTDQNIGWFAGRMSLELTEKTYIDDVFVYTKDISNSASMQLRLSLRNDKAKPFQGKVSVNFYRWYPEEDSESVTSKEFPISIRAWSQEIVEENFSIAMPKLWTFDNPNLYKAEVILKDKAGNSIDDYVVTTGIRTISQQGGTFRVNGKPEMLNGAQIMGFRMPVDKLATWNRCAPKEWLAKELLMTKKMNGNMMRVHVHAWESPARNINDPRLAEMGDQLGIMFIWATTGWIRTGQPWGVDFDGYPKYMRQVYNHPSIVMWEAANHPNQFKRSDVSESNLYVEKVYNTIYPVDPSRLISVSSHIRNTHYGNDKGTIDYKGNAMQPCAEWTADMVTRGNQDSITGYGNEWSGLRKWPGAYTKSFLESKERAYFNFEHEESIGQPNWSLAKGKPWYQLQSYEWDYDTGSIGQRLTVEQWQQSQAWQAFSAYESMKKQRLVDYDGFSWCCLHGGANTGTYKKPLIDSLGYAKLAYYTNKMIFQRVVGASDNVDVVYGPDDSISPVIINLGDSRKVELKIIVRDMKDSVVDTRIYSDIELAAGRTVTSLDDFKPAFTTKGFYAIEYYVTE